VDFPCLWWWWRRWVYFKLINGTRYDALKSYFRTGYVSQSIFLEGTCLRPNPPCTSNYYYYYYIWKVNAWEEGEGIYAKRKCFYLILGRNPSDWIVPTNLSSWFEINEIWLYY
jgi:hypothetical protein